jgi:hypothetical protein
VSPREGQLLRLQPGSFFRLRGEAFSITTRQIARSPRGPVVVLHGEGVVGAVDLWVPSADGGSVAYLGPITLRRRVTADEIEVISAERV